MVQRHSGRASKNFGTGFSLFQTSHVLSLRFRVEKTSALERYDQLRDEVRVLMNGCIDRPRKKERFIQILCEKAQAKHFSVSGIFGTNSSLSAWASGRWNGLNEIRTTTPFALSAAW
jgi:hypothetical protein